MIRPLSLAVLPMLLAGCGGDAEPEQTTPLVSVETARIVRADMPEWLDAFGTVAAAPAGGGSSGGLVRLAAPVASVVRALPVREGQQVGAGTLIARLDDGLAAAQLTQAQTDASLARQRLDRQQKLLAIGGVARNTVEDARQQATAAGAGVAAAQVAVARNRLVTPIAGTVSRVYVFPGQAVDPGTTVADIVNGARLSLSFAVPADQAHRLRIGQAVVASASDAGGEVEGRVVTIDPVVDPASGTVAVRASLSAAGGWRRGQAIAVRVKVADHPGALVVPKAAVYTDHDGKSSIALVSNGKARRLPVRLIAEDGTRDAVEAPGLQPGAVAVTTGSYALEDGTRVRTGKAR